MGDEKRFEEGLRGVRLRRPAPNVRSELMAQARREARTRGRLRRASWVLVAAAVLLLVINILAVQLYCPSPHGPADGINAADGIELVPTSSEAIRFRHDVITNTRPFNGDPAAPGE